ncbi:sensor histidine kinase [Nakamurella flava]|uniref:histidine kinase n=1 Tax=Nakamurella flava TaxID=2576308 RepID=A0A4U6QA12_9ACTN|nr:histidine kinase [Nakamurella flava]TKV56787.1 sensor histidine kinase [Nakamurella flava]
MQERLTRWLSDSRWPGDALVALAAALLVLFTGGNGGYVEWLANTALVATLVFRRTQPRLMIVMVAGLCLLQILLTSRPLLGDLVIAAVVHASAAYIADRRWGKATLTLALVGAGLAAVRWSVIPDSIAANDAPGVVTEVPTVLMNFLAGAAAVTVMYLLGSRQRDRRERAAEQVSAMEERTRLLTAERDRRVELAAAAERARIARDLHDIVAHSLAVIVVQAQGARAAALADPSVAPAALDTIAETSRDALAQMRQMVGVLRAGGPDPTGRPADDGPVPGGSVRTAPLQPAPDLAALPALVEAVRTTGLPVHLQVSVPPDLPVPVQLTTYRIVQEGLTNVLKHGGPAASVRITVTGPQPSPLGPALRVTVIDDGRGAADDPAAPPGEPGHGLRGMRERVELLGGDLRAGARPGGGFAITAVLPVQRLVPGRS